MHAQYPRAALRIAAFGAVLLLAGTALAATKTSTSTTKADCASAAALQFSIDNAQCAAYPAGSEASNYCQASAAQKYSLAIVACDQALDLHGSSIGPSTPKVRTGLVRQQN